MLLVVSLVVLSLGIGMDRAIAVPCYQTDSHSICLVSVKRSAKQFWEYRAVVSMDGVQREQEVYNCRDRQRIQADGRVVAFEPDGAGEVICRKLYRPGRSPVQ
ncbi:MAG: hypothetical protein IGR76_02290 [Synechococcales cyanobacterium T60_A2020_003]|nr:hypothetical protein [Synechococcales cyanobacterium T60_A2020_003]